MNGATAVGGEGVGNLEIGLDTSVTTTWGQINQNQDLQDFRRLLNHLEQTQSTRLRGGNTDEKNHIHSAFGGGVEYRADNTQRMGRQDCFCVSF